MKVKIGKKHFKMKVISAIMKDDLMTGTTLILKVPMKRNLLIMIFENLKLEMHNSKALDP